MKIIFTTLVLIMVMVLSVNASEFNLYTQAGGMNTTERDIREGGKSYHLLGIGIKSTDSLSFNIEGFARGEAEDDNPETPRWGIGVQSKYTYKLEDWVHPYLGLRLDHIERGTAPKYKDGDYKQRTVHNFSSVLAGLHLVHEKFWVDLGINIPWYTNTKSGNFGPDFGIGFIWNNWDLGLRHKKINFTDHHFQKGVNDFSFAFTGVQLRYNF